MADLDDILNSEPAEIAGQPRDESGRFAPKEQAETGVAEAVEAAPEPEEAPPAPAAKQLPPEEYAALKDERRKRQALERELEQMRSKPVTTEESTPPDFWENPNQFLDQWGNQFGEQLMQRIEARTWQANAQKSEMAARAKYDDFDDKIATFHELAAADPRLAQELRSAPDVAEFAYRKATEAMMLQEHGGITGLLQAERAKWEAELRSSAPVIPQVPLSTAAERSVASRGGPAWTGPKSLDELLQ